jgi:Domain of Unknown Function with PDB structure (DUF3857)
MKYKIFIPILFLFFSTTNAQNKSYSVLSIPESLTVNANSIVRYQSTDVTILSQKSISIKIFKVITVLNSQGLSNVDAREYYNKSEKINLIQATIYNSKGQEIKKVKRRDFLDQSVADGFSVLTDRRFLSLDYTPTDYPFTVVYESETQSENTASIPAWFLIDDYFESVEKSEFNISYPFGVGFKYKEYGTDNSKIIKTQKANSVSFSVENIPAERYEELSLSAKKIFPHIVFGLNNFYYEGYLGNTKTWGEFSSWYYNSLIKDTEALSTETKVKIRNLIGSETDLIKKAKIIYKYVQDKTRYVSIQLGIGGLKPMLAADVDRLGYGDCKALSNYTRALLKEVGIESFLTIIYSGKEIIDFDKDFVSLGQGDHMILTIPNNDKLLFLECTSQTVPFGYQGRFTDNRYALLLKPENGELVKTNEYSEKNSSQISKGSFTIDEFGSINGNIIIKSKGIQYDDKYGLETLSKEKMDEYYKDYFSWVNNLKIEKIKFSNDKENVEFTEDLKISANNYGSLNGAIMMISINVFNQNSNIPQRYRNRKNPFEISRGYYDEDEIEVNLPEGFGLDTKPENYEIKDKFGTYKIEFVLIGTTKILYKRLLTINKGFYDNIEYENYRKFREQIAKLDNSKIVLKLK